MKKIILILIVISGINSFAQTPTQWLYKETVRSEFVDVIQTADGGYLSCGSRYNIDTNTLMGSILKFDTNGVIDWEQPYYTLPSCNSNTYDFEISKIKQSNDGNYYFVLNFLKRYLPSCQARIIKISAAGQYLGETLLPEIGYVEDFIVTNQNEFVYVSDKKLNKIDSSGNLLWSINPGVNFDSFYKIIKTVDGNYAITGQRRDTNLANNEDLAVVTIDSAGNILDTMRMNSSLVDSGRISNKPLMEVLLW